MVSMPLSQILLQFVVILAVGFGLLGLRALLRGDLGVLGVANGEKPRFTNKRQQMWEKYRAKERLAREIRARQREAEAYRTMFQEREAEEEAALPPEIRHLETFALHRATLQLDGEVTETSIKAAYKQRVREYHPDLVVNLGCKLQDLAEDETKRINEAYAFFRQHLDF